MFPPEAPMLSDLFKIVACSGGSRICSIDGTRRRLATVLSAAPPHAGVQSKFQRGRGIMTRGIRRLILTATLLVLASSTGRAGPRVASLNLCADQLILLLADRSDIASLSPLAFDPDLSYLADP